MSLTSKLFLRKLFDNPNTLFRIIVYSPQNVKVRPVTSLYKLIPVEKVVSSDIRTHKLEIAFSEPEEQALYEEYPRRIENCVSDSNDDVPELEFILDLTPEVKEVQQLRDDKRFDQDTEVAIQLSLDCSEAYQKLNDNQPHSTQNTVTDRVTKYE